MLLVFLLDVVVGCQPGPWCRDQARQRDSTSSHLKEFEEKLEKDEEQRFSVTKLEDHEINSFLKLTVEKLFQRTRNTSIV